MTQITQVKERKEREKREKEKDRACVLMVSVKKRLLYKVRVP